MVLLLLTLTDICRYSVDLDVAGATVLGDTLDAAGATTLAGLIDASTLVLLLL